MPKGQLFSVREGERAMLLALAEVRDAPLPLTVAAPQIAQFLVTRKHKELAAAEVERLRQGAKIEYLNKDLALDAHSPPAARPAGAAGAPGGAVQSSAVPVATPAAPAAGNGAPAAARSQPVPDNAALDRGVAGLK